MRKTPAGHNAKAMPRFGVGLDQKRQSEMQPLASTSEALLEEARAEAPEVNRFFLPAVFEENPFAEQLEQMERSRMFRRQSRDYERRLEHSTPAKIAVSLMGTVMAIGAYYVSKLSDSPVLGILAGGVTSPLLDTIPRKAMKRWFPPSDLLQREAELQQLDDKIQKGKLTTELGDVWPRLSFDKPRNLWHRLWSPVNEGWHPASFSSRYQQPEEPAILMAMALISRYPAQQEALKKALPAIRGKYLTRCKILPFLHKMLQQPPGYGSIHREPNALMHQAVNGMLAYVEQEHHHLNTRFDSAERNKLRRQYITHLQKALPDLIRYLEG